MAETRESGVRQTGYTRATAAAGHFSSVLDTGQHRKHCSSFPASQSSGIIVFDMRVCEVGMSQQHQQWTVSTDC